MEKQDYDYDAVIRDIAFNGFDVVDNRENHQQDNELKRLSDKLNLRASFLNDFKDILSTSSK